MNQQTVDIDTITARYQSTPFITVPKHRNTDWCSCLNKTYYFYSNKCDFAWRTCEKQSYSYTNCCVGLHDSLRLQEMNGSTQPFINDYRKRLEKCLCTRITQTFDRFFYLQHKVLYKSMTTDLSLEQHLCLASAGKIGQA